MRQIILVVLFLVLANSKSLLIRELNAYASVNPATLIHPVFVQAVS